MDVLEFVNTRYPNQKFTKESIFYRHIRAEYVVDKKNGVFFIEGNPNSVGEINNIYNNNEDILAKSLEEPGLAVMTAPTRLCNGVKRPLTVSIKLDDILETDGKIYPYNCAGSEFWYLTIPKEDKIPVQIYSGSNYLAELGFLYNKIKDNQNIVEYLQEWEHGTDKLFEMHFSKRINNEFIEPINVGYTINNETLELKRIGSHPTLPGNQLRDLTITYVLIEHPDITQIMYPDQTMENVSTFLRNNCK